MILVSSNSVRVYTDIVDTACVKLGHTLLFSRERACGYSPSAWFFMWISYRCKV